MPLRGPPAPTQEPIAQLSGAEKGLIHPRWQRHIQGLRDAIDAAPFRYASVTLTGQTAAIATTAIPTADQPAGLYRAAAITRITTADGVSSSVAVTILWTRGGVAQSVTLTANTGDATHSVVSESVPLFRIDTGTPISYATSYASTTAANMTYELDVVLERIQG